MCSAVSFCMKNCPTHPMPMTCGPAPYTRLASPHAPLAKTPKSAPAMTRRTARSGISSLCMKSQLVLTDTLGYAAEERRAQLLQCNNVEKEERGMLAAG